MLYSKNLEKFNDDVFKNPPCEYRATPFWAWNSHLEKDELLWQIEKLKEMGFGGFHMHVRSGMDTVYLSDEYFDLVGACVNKAKEQNMLAWLYDEDRWPSGAGGGYVTKDVENRQRRLLFSLNPSTNENDEFLSAYDIIFDNDGFLLSYNKIGFDEKAKGVKRYAYLNTEKVGNPWFNNQCYLDIINDKAVKRFIDVTHEAYKEHFGKDFGGVIPAIFTDEPQTAWQAPAKTAFDESTLELPWTIEFCDKYYSAYGEDVLATLPEIFYEKKNNELSTARYRFREFLTELFSTCFADQCGIWCEQNNIALTGHVMAEERLGSQTFSVGDTMRTYRHFGIPGIDMLCDNHEYTTAKQCQSAVNQNGAEAMLCELDGVTNWNFDFKHHKHHGDWQAALGVTVRVPHLSWYSMNGEAKRDYPASINYQAAFCNKYHLIEDYFARISTALTRGKRNCRIAVFHPVRTYWMHYGQNDKTKEYRDKLDHEWFLPLCEQMLRHQLDFDYICDGNLGYQVDFDKITDKLCVGNAEYDVVLMPACEVISKTAFDILSKFALNGGKIIFSGECPKYVDGIKTNAVEPLYNSSVKIEKSVDEVIKSLESYRNVLVTLNDNQNTNYIYQMRDDGDEKWLFISPANYPDDEDFSEKESVCVRINGEYYASVYDAMSGNIYDVKQCIKDGYTYIYKDLFCYDTLLIRYTKSPIENVMDALEYNDIFTASIEPTSFSLCEPNILLLDKAEYKLDDEDWRSEEEILRLDAKVREKIGLTDRKVGFAQPWVINNNTPTNTLTLKYTFESKIYVENVLLALEYVSGMKIAFNGEQIDKKPSGYYVDKCIKTIDIGSVKIGTNEIVVTMPYHEKANPEAMYLLGKFGVYDNKKPFIDSLPNKLEIGDVSNQGLMFYGGNIDYKFNVDVKNNSFNIRLPKFRGALAEILIDNEYVGDIIVSPFAFCIDNLENGIHEITVRIIGTRINTFGQLHYAFAKGEDKNTAYAWWGPESWRTKADNWSYDYLTWSQGLLEKPLIN